MKIIIAFVLLFYFNHSIAQININQLKLDEKTTIDHKLCEVCVRYIGETYNYIAPFNGWSELESGTLNYIYQSEKRNPYDNHPYLLYSDNQIPPHIKTNKILYRIIDGYKYSGELTDSIINKQNNKEISFKGTYKNGLLDGYSIFYFTSNDKSNEANIKVGEIKSEGHFSKGMMIKEWKYYGYTSYLISKDKYLLEDRIYNENSIFPIKGKHYKLNNNKEIVVGSEYEYEGIVIKFVKQFSVNGDLTSYEELIDYKIVGSNVEDFLAEYNFTSYYENQIIQAKGKYIGKPKYHRENGLWKFYNEKGILTSETNYKDGKIDGVLKTFYNNGKKKKIELYTNEKVKIIDYWNENGKHLVKKGSGKIESINGNLIETNIIINGEIETSYKRAKKTPIR